MLVPDDGSRPTTSMPCGASRLGTRSGSDVYWVDSSGRRNTAYVSCLEELVQSLGRCSPAQGLSRSAVEGDRHGRKVLGAVHAEVSDGVDAPRRHRRAKVVVLTAT